MLSVTFDRQLAAGGGRGGPGMPNWCLYLTKQTCLFRNHRSTISPPALLKKESRATDRKRFFSFNDAFINKGKRRARFRLLYGHVDLKTHKKKRTVNAASKRGPCPAGPTGEGLRRGHEGCDADADTDAAVSLGLRCRP